jgi:hypothetical protein
MKRLAPLLLLLVVAACAAGPNPLTGVPAADGIMANFWRGLWRRR